MQSQGLSSQLWPRLLALFWLLCALTFERANSLRAQDALRAGTSSKDTKSGDQSRSDSSTGDTSTESLFKQAINPTSIVLVNLDVPRLNLPKSVQETIAADNDAQPLLGWLAAIRSTFAPLSESRLAVLIDVPFSETHAPVRFIAQKPVGLDLAKLNEQLATFRFSPAVVEGETISTSPSGNLSASNGIRVGSETLPEHRSAFSAAAAAVKDLPLQILIVPPAYISSTYEDLMSRLPESWGGTPTATITEGIQWAAIGVDPAQLRLQVIIQSKTAAAAERLTAELPKLVKVIKDSPSMLRFKPALNSLKVTQPVVNQDRIEVSFSEIEGLGAAAGVIMQAMRAIIDPLNLLDKQDRFKQLSLAVHNYASANKVLPPGQAARRADGSSYLSWRVHILPYIGESKLYSEFKLNEPWNSQHNIKLLDKMPDLFASYPVPAFTRTIERGHTTFLAPTGEGTIFGGKKPVQFGQIKDGTSNTILFVEVKPERAVPWTAPIDYEFPVADPAEGLALGSDGKFLCALSDGAVIQLPANLPKETLVHLFQMNDGHEVKLP